MELDTGSNYSILSSYWWKQFGKPLLRRGPPLWDVSKNLVPVLGIGFVNVSLNGLHKLLRVVFLATLDTNSILGREWISAFDLSVPRDTSLDARVCETSGTSVSHSTSSVKIDSNLDIDQPSHLIASSASFPKKTHRAAPAGSANKAVTALNSSSSSFARFSTKPRVPSGNSSSDSAKRPSIPIASRKLRTAVSSRAPAALVHSTSARSPKAMDVVTLPPRDAAAPPSRDAIAHVIKPPSTDARKSALRRSSPKSKERN